MYKFFILKFKAVFKCAVDDLIDSVFIINKKFIVDTNLVKERCSSDSFVQMRNNVIDVVHEEMLGFHIVKAEESKILIN